MDPMSPVASEIAIASDTNPRPRQRARRDPRGANTRGNLDVDAHVRVLNPRLGDVALVDVDDLVRVVNPRLGDVEVLHGEAALEAVVMPAAGEAFEADEEVVRNESDEITDDLRNANCFEEMFTYAGTDHMAMVQVSVTSYNGNHSLCIADGMFNSPNNKFHLSTQDGGEHNVITSFRFNKSESSNRMAWVVHKPRLFQDFVWAGVNGDETVKTYGYVLTHGTLFGKYHNDAGEAIAACNAFWNPRGFVFGISSEELSKLTPMVIVLKEDSHKILLLRNHGYYNLIDMEQRGLIKLAKMGLIKTQLHGEIVHACCRPEVIGKVRQVGSALRAHLRIAKMKNMKIEVWASDGNMISLML